MTDTITPASLRAHADWIDTTFEPGSVEARSLRNCAARLEAESARAELVGKLAQKIYEIAPQLGAFQEVFDVARTVLDFLAADGRLLPEGGTAQRCLNCDDSGDVHSPDGEWRGICHCPAGDEIRATPPAVSVPDSGPDGTPEKPWPTWQDVPEGVVYRSAAETRPLSNWVNRGGQRYAVFPSGKEEPSVKRDEYVQALAPFVRVDGDQA